MRMPEGLRQRLAAAAEKSGRSMNAEAIILLEQALDRRDALSDDFDIREEFKKHRSWMIMMMEVLSKSEDKTFDPVREVLNGMEEAGKKAAVEWFRKNEMQGD